MRNIISGMGTHVIGILFSADIIQLNRSSREYIYHLSIELIRISSHVFNIKFSSLDIRLLELLEFDGMLLDHMGTSDTSFHQVI